MSQYMPKPQQSGFGQEILKLVCEIKYSLQFLAPEMLCWLLFFLRLYPECVVLSSWRGWITPLLVPRSPSWMPYHISSSFVFRGIGFPFLGNYVALAKKHRICTPTSKAMQSKPIPSHDSAHCPFLWLLITLAWCQFTQLKTGIRAGCSG